MFNPEDLKRGRPKMGNYGITADEDGLLSWEWVSQRMEKSRNYWIITVNLDDAALTKPHAAPVWGVWLDNELHFGSSRKSRKGRNIAQNPYVVMHLESGDEVVIFEGVLEEMVNPERALRERIVKVYGEKYAFTPEIEPDPDEAWYILRPKVIMAWLENDFPKTATRWTV